MLSFLLIFLLQGKVSVSLLNLYWAEIFNHCNILMMQDLHYAGCSVHCICNGRDALPGECPWNVKIIRTNHRLNRALVCRGTIISTQHVITTGFCIYMEDENNLRVLVGSFEQDGFGSITYHVKKLILHDKFDVSYDFVNLGIIQVRKSYVYQVKSFTLH